MPSAREIARQALKSASDSLSGTGSAAAISLPLLRALVPLFLDLSLPAEAGQAARLALSLQPNDAALIINLDTWVRDLTPNTSYQLQRAADTTIDGTCTSTAWLTLGKGLTPATIDTDERGTGRAELFRSVAAFPVGSAFDIHFQVVDAATGAVVLHSDCYRFTISL